MKPRSDLPEMVEPPCWEVSPPDLSEFLHQLPGFAPDDSVLCLEGVGAPDIETYLLVRPATYENETDQGFFKLRSKILYMHITDENLQGLAVLSEKYADPEVCCHLRLYRGGRVILSWNDVPFDPFYVANEIDETSLRKYCEILGCKYLMNADAA